MSERPELYFVKAISRLGRSIKSGPWSAHTICKKAISYQQAGFSEVLVVELAGQTEFALERFLSDHPRGKHWR